MVRCDITRTERCRPVTCTYCRRYPIISHIHGGVCRYCLKLLTLRG